MESVVSTSHLTWLQSFAQRQLFNMAQTLTDVGLEIIDQEQVYFFGEKSAALQASLEVLDPKFYLKILLGGSIASGETWVDESWRSDDLTAVIRVFARCAEEFDTVENQFSWLSAPLLKLYQWRTQNSKAGSRSNIAAHYDLGNDMYLEFLDPMMQYSAGVFTEPHTDLATAQQIKLKTLCDKLALKTSDHLLEVGTGWGGLAIFAAKNYGCKVTTTTLSQEQFNYAKAWVEKEGLADKITLLLSDYRDLEGEYDKIISVEMIEAVGHKFLPTYFKKLDSLLKPQGRLVIQAITIADQRYDAYRSSTDFIQKYIFPGGCLPSVSEMCRHLKNQTDMTLTELNSYGHDYAQTLKCWANNFSRSSQALKKQGYGEDFQRLWQYYFSYCEGGFLEGRIDLVHIQADKTAARRQSL